ncbi:MAG: bile acid:sodium symporter family protein [Verrucomicrobiota bacterium]
MLVSVVLPLVLAFIMFSLGLGLRGQDFARVFQQPKVFAVGLGNQLILLPLVAFGIASIFQLPPLLAVGTMIIALCPGGVTSNMLTRIANGTPPLSISLTAVASLLSVLTVPVMVGWIVGYFQIEQAREVDVTAIGIKMFLITAVPVAFGMLLTHFAPKLVERISRLVGHVALVLFALIVFLAIRANWDALMKYASVLGPALLALMAIMLTLGLVTGRLLRVTRREATTISLESGIQNATLGIAVAGFIGAEASGGALPDSALPSAVYGVLMYLVVVPFVLWRRRVHGIESAVS